jgi:hypothetical protein
MEKLDILKQEIYEKGLVSAKDFFGLDLKNTKITPEEVKNFFNRAKLGLGFIREFSASERIENGQKIRVLSMIAENPKELKRYIEISMPKFMPKKI